jgi:phosphoglycolate phosphatase
MINTIVLDWSGTISNDFPAVYESVMNLLEDYGDGRISIEEARNEFCLPYMNFYKKYTPGLNKAERDNKFKQFFIVNKEKYPTYLHNGVKEALAELKRQDFDLYILSAHIGEELIKEAKEYGIHDYFTSVFSSVTDKIISLGELINEFDLIKEETAYVGDMCHDIKAGNENRVTSVAVTYGYHTRKKLEAAKPNIIIDDLNELLKFI